MMDLLLLGNFFLGLINLCLLISIGSQLIDLEADLYYYSECKCKGDDDDNLQHTDDCVMFSCSGGVSLVCSDHSEGFYCFFSSCMHCFLK